MTAQRRDAILLVDDQPENLVALSATLEPLGHELVHAASGEEALKLLLKREFAVILLDVQMPELDGFETAALIKQRERSRHIPIIFVTALSRDAEHVFRGYSEGAVDYLLKPYDPNALRSKVEVFVQLREKSAALEESERRFRAAFANAPSGMGLVSADGRWIQVNRALVEILGHSQAELIGRPWESILLPEERAADRKAIDELLAGKRARHQAERRCRRADGREALLLLSLSAPSDGRARPSHLIVQAEDVTAREQAERERAERLRQQAARAEAEAVAETLQRSLLPAKLPSLPGVELAARYLPGGRGQVGGDWYDAVALENGSIGLAMGDVVGHGLAAAAQMGQLRNALRAYALEGHPPAAVLAKLDRLLQRSDRATMATLVYAEIAGDWSRVRYACAGHLPPLLIAPSGAAEYLWDGRGAPLGVAAAEPYEEGEAKLEKGTSLAFYTDGLVEVRGEVLDVGLGRLSVAAAGGPPGAEALCEHLIDSMVAEGGASDDVALLTLRTARLGEGHTKLELTTDPSTLVNVRLLLARWLREAGASEQEVYDIQLACHEACANAIEHAYGFADARFDLELSREGRDIELAVTDAGGWREPNGGDRGRGIWLMRATMRDVEVHGGPEGTSVRLRRRLGAGEPEPAPAAMRVAAD